MTGDVSSSKKSVLDGELGANVGELSPAAAGGLGVGAFGRVAAGGSPPLVNRPRLLWPRPRGTGVSGSWIGVGRSGRREVLGAPAAADARDRRFPRPLG